MNPLRYLRPAVYAALTRPALVLASGAVLPVRAYGSAATEPVYLLLSPDQDTQNLTQAGRACTQWDCTLLVDVVTLHQNGALSVALADEVADAVTERLHQYRPMLPAGLQLLRAVVESVNGGSQLDGEQVDIHRYLRLRYSLAYQGGAVGPAPAVAPVPAPATGTSLTLTLTATQTVVGGQLLARVGGNLVPYDAANAALAGALVGVALNTANAGQSVRVQEGGDVTVLGWGLVPDAVYFAGPNGSLVRTDAGLAFSQFVGRALSADALFFDPQTAFIL